MSNLARSAGVLLIAVAACTPDPAAATQARTEHPAAPTPAAPSQAEAALPTPVAPAAPRVPAVTGMVPTAYWRLDDGSGPLARDSGPGRVHARNVAAASASGIVSGSLHFDGAKAHLAARIPNESPIGALEAWVRLSEIPVRRCAIVADVGASQGLVLLAGGQPCLALAGGDGLVLHATAPGRLAVGSWVHLLATFDAKAGRMALYVDGIQAASMPLNGPVMLDRQVRIGGDGDQAGFAGDLDEVRIWPAALDAAAAARLAAAGRAGRSALPDLLPDASFTAATSPREIQPPVTPVLEARIQAMPAARGQVLRDAGGAPELRVDGRRVALFGGQQLAAHYGRDVIQIAPYRDGGMELLVVSVNCGFFHPDAGYRTEAGLRPPFWEGAGRYCADSLAPDLWRSLAVHPDAALVVWLWIDPYPAFATEHPDAVIRNLRGDPLVISSHFLRYDAKGPDQDARKHEKLAISFHSEDYLRDGAAMCAELVKAVERTVPGRRVAGYLIGGGQDAQLYDWNPPDHILAKDASAWGDFSPAARVAWGRWLATRYGSADRVAAAWGRPVADLASAPVPTADDLVGTATLHDPVQGRIAIDWNRFTAESRQRLLSTFATAVKGAASRPVVVGVCGGDSPARKDLAQTGGLMRDPAIDFFLHQPAYSQRQPGLLGGVNAHLASHAVNGKLFFADLDHPTWLVADGQKSSIGVISQTSDSRGRAQDADALAAMWRRDLGALAAAGQGALVHPILGGPWMYNDPEVIAEFRFLHGLMSSTRPSPAARPEAGVTWINDERSIAWLKGGLANVHHAWMRGQQNELMLSGAPFAAYYAQDLEDGLVPAGPLVLLQNLVSLTPRMTEALKRLQGGGRTLVFLQGTGWEQLRAGRIDDVAAATGIRLVPRAAGVTARAVADPDAIPIRAGSWALTAPSTGRGAALLAATPPAVAWNGGVDLGWLDGIQLAGGTPSEDRAMRVRGVFTLDAAGLVSIGVRSDWWSAIEIDGRPVLTIDRTATGGSPDRPQWSSLRLEAGEHRIEGRVVSGSGGFRLGITLNRGEPAICRLQSYVEDAQAITVDDPAAAVLARYRDGSPSFARVDHGSWSSVFIGAWSVTGDALGRLAAQAGCWTACPPGMAVVSRGGDLLVIHALVDGPIPLRLPQAAALDPIGPGTALPRSEQHRIEVRRGETRLYRVH